MTSVYSVPSVTLHPSETAFAGQSMDNSIVTYQCGEKVRQMAKKTFKGHSGSGYACQIGFSPNGMCEWVYYGTYWYVLAWYVLWHVLVCIIFGMYYMYW